MATGPRYRRTNAELAEIDEVIFTILREEHPATLRSVFYRVVSAGKVPKTEEGYGVIGRQLLKLRRGGIIPYGWVTDGTRYVIKPKTFDEIDEMLNDVAASYRRALWNDQLVDVQIITEKDAIVGTISPVCREFDVPLGVVRGYSSESFAWQIGESVRGTEWPVYFYQLGDHDPSVA